MTLFSPLDPADADGEARDILDAVTGKFGFVPNLVGNMAHAPKTAQAYLTLGELMGQTSFDTVEEQVILLAVSRYNECGYCVSAHSAISAMQQLPADVVDAIRSDMPIPDEKLEALRAFTTKVVDQRGWLSEDDVDAFLAAGYVKSQVLEVILGVAMKTISNYTNHIAGTALDGAFADFAWEAPSRDVA